MSHLDKLSSFLEAPTTLIGQSMTMRSQDSEPDFLIGSGEVYVDPQGGFTYRMNGSPPDLSHSMRALARQRANPYDSLNRFRLELNDEAGAEWFAGWTVPEIDLVDGTWVLTGSCQALLINVEGGADGLGGAEVRFPIPRGYSATPLLLRGLGNVDGDGRRSRIVEVLGNSVSFIFDVQSHLLSISTPSSTALPAHMAENWLAEPLRILFGQPIYPRLVERKFPDGRSMLWVRPVVRWSHDSSWAGLWTGTERLVSEDSFFDLYAGLLSIVSKVEIWEANPLTEFYDQVIAAAEGSRWIMALTLSSSVEGVVRMLVPRDTLRPDADPTAIDSLVEHIRKWDGATRLKDNAIASVKRADTAAVGWILRDFSKKGVGTKDQYESWLKVRNSVMHGEMISPYSSEEDDRLILALGHLLHALTRELIRVSR